MKQQERLKLTAKDEEINERERERERIVGWRLREVRTDAGKGE